VATIESHQAPRHAVPASDYTHQEVAKGTLPMAAVFFCSTAPWPHDPVNGFDADIERAMKGNRQLRFVGWSKAFRVD
jgi:hypothetical protein